MKNFKFLAAVLFATAAFALSASAQTSLVGLDGSRVDVQGQRGKVVILAVGAGWLPLSRTQADYTNALMKKYSGRDVVIYFVATDSTVAKSKNFASNDDIKKFATANKLGVTVLRDGDGALTLKKFSIDQIPSFVILDKNGNMVGQPFGGIDPNYDVTVPISKVVDRIL
jgi:thiol-disulfide isomerase/thioredoxin